MGHGLKGTTGHLLATHFKRDFISNSQQLCYDLGIVVSLSDDDYLTSIVWYSRIKTNANKNKSQDGWQ